MKIEKGRFDILLVLIVIIAVLAIGLGYMQFKWINSFSKTNELRLRSSLQNSAVHAINSTRVETTLLSSIIYLTNDEITDSDYSRFQEDLESWKESTPFDGLLKSIFLARFEKPEEASQIYRWNNDESDFIEISTPSVFSTTIGALRAGDYRGLNELQERMQPAGIFMINVVRPPEEENHPRTTLFPSILIIEFDAEYLYQTVLPYYTEKYFKGFPFSIIDTGKNTTVFSSAQPKENRAPELSIPVNRPILSKPDDQNEHIITEDFSAALFMKLWLTITEEIQNEMLPEETPEILLNIYYPEESLSEQVNRTKTMNMVVSFGFILLFMAALIILYSLYRKTRDLRIRERNFISSMSHELRTPIAVIRSTSDTLKKGIVTDPERIAQYSGVISRQTERLSESVEGILKYSGLINNGTDYKETEINNISEITANIAEEMELLINEKGGVLVKRVAPEITMRINPEAFRMILENLLSNAVKHSMDSTAVHQRPGEVHIDLYREDKNFILLVISDKGPGISILDKNRIFQPFFRAKRSRDNQTPGSGLGLHLVSNTVKMLEGTVEVQSPCFPEETADRKGCRFIVRLPDNRNDKTDNNGEK